MDLSQMIRNCRLPISKLNSWLVTSTNTNGTNQFHLRLWRENRAALPAILPDVLAYLEEAFDDARRRLRRGFEDTLSPFSEPALDPAANYPRALHQVTLHGYLGEILGVLAVEHWGAGGFQDWEAPAFLFRFHEQEFQHLEEINERVRRGEIYEPDENRELRLGRTGNDGLVFRLSEQNVITHVMSLESKCLNVNNNQKINDAFGKLSAAGPLPSGVRELIEIMRDYDHIPKARIWQEALLRYRSNDYLTAQRIDGVAYSCGRIPHPPRMTWMNQEAPAPTYTATRRVEAMEFQISDLAGLVQQVLRP